MLISTNTPQATSGPPAIEWKIFSDPEIGFSIKYPSTWYFFRSSSSPDDITQGGFVLFSSSLGNTSIQSRTEDEEARLAISFIPHNSTMDVDGWLEGSPLLSYDVTRPIINGFQGVRITTPSKNEDDLSSHIFLFLVTPAIQYSLVGTISVSSNSSIWSDVIISMQDSFTPK
jgi:hypothetical protein